MSDWKSPVFKGCKALGREGQDGKGRPGECTSLSKGPKLKGTSDGPPNRYEGQSGQGESGFRQDETGLNLFSKAQPFLYPNLSTLCPISPEEVLTNHNTRAPIGDSVPITFFLSWEVQFDHELYRQEESGKPCPSPWYLPPT